MLWPNFGHSTTVICMLFVLISNHISTYPIVCQFKGFRLDGISKSNDNNHYVCKSTDIEDIKVSSGMKN